MFKTPTLLGVLKTLLNYWCENTVKLLVLYRQITGVTIL